MAHKKYTKQINFSSDRLENKNDPERKQSGSPHVPDHIERQGLAGQRAQTCKVLCLVLF